MMEGRLWIALTPSFPAGITDPRYNALAYGLGPGVGRGLGVGSARRVGVGLGVGVGVVLGVVVGVAIAVGVGPPVGDTRTKETSSSCCPRFGLKLKVAGYATLPPVSSETMVM